MPTPVPALEEEGLIVAERGRHGAGHLLLFGPVLQFEAGLKPALPSAKIFAASAETWLGCAGRDRGIVVEADHGDEPPSVRDPNPVAGADLLIEFDDVAVAHEDAARAEGFAHLVLPIGAMDVNVAVMGVHLEAAKVDSRPPGPRAAAIRSGS